MHRWIEITEIAWVESNPVAIVICSIFCFVERTDIVIEIRLQVLQITFQLSIIDSSVCLIGFERFRCIIFLPLKAYTGLFVTDVCGGSNDSTGV